MSEAKEIVLPENLSVRNLAALLNVEPTELMGKLIANGVLAHINQEIDHDTAALIASEYGWEVKEETIKQIATRSQTTGEKRPPIVTIMGHVDHGKTTLLDYIRSSNVAATESGGITQHISAYQINFTMGNKERRVITFIDTPGHEAFGAIRAHGASLTDLVVLVVAADDGVKPQTLEAYEMAKKANVPIVVAINKIDAPGANQERVKQQLTEIGLTPEDWGGKTITVPISAKNGSGVNDLLEMIVLATDILELKADKRAAFEGIVIEASRDKQIGPRAVVLVYNGVLRLGQIVFTGKTYGRVRSMTDDQGRPVVEAQPSLPVTVSGFKDVPSFGERVQVVPSEKVARSMLNDGTIKKSSAHEGKNLSLIVKADVGGSLAALLDILQKQKYHDAGVEIVASGIGQLTESDLKMAQASGASVLVFRSSPAKRLLELAQRDGILIKESWVIYELTNYVQEKLREIASPIVERVTLGRLKVLAVFKQKKGEAIIGGEVLEGEIVANKPVIVTREKEEIGQGEAKEIQENKISVDRVEKGRRCGVSLVNAPEIAVGDVLIFQDTKIIT